MTETSDRSALKEKLVQLKADYMAKSRVLHSFGMMNMPRTAEEWAGRDLAEARAKIECEEAMRSFDRVYREYIRGESP